MHRARDVSQCTAYPGWPSESVVVCFAQDAQAKAHTNASAYVFMCSAYAKKAARCNIKQLVALTALARPKSSGLSWQDGHRLTTVPPCGTRGAIAFRLLTIIQLLRRTRWKTGNGQGAVCMDWQQKAPWRLALPGGTGRKRRLSCRAAGRSHVYIIIGYEGALRSRIFLKA